MSRTRAQVFLCRISSDTIGARVWLWTFHSIGRRRGISIAPRSLLENKRSARSNSKADEIRLEVREGARALEQAKRNYEISQLGVQLAERRVEEQNVARRSRSRQSAGPGGLRRTISSRRKTN